MTDSTTPAANNAPPAQARVPTAPVAVSNPTVNPAQQRWAADRAAAAKGDPWQSDPASTVMLKDKDGNITFRPRSDGSPGDPANPGDSAQAIAEGGKLRIGEMELDEKDIRQIMTETAAREARKATLPADPSAYTLDLPADFQMPEGVQWKWNTADPVQGPLLNMAREFAHAHNIDQAGFSKMLSLYAAAQTHETTLINKARAGEIAKLGATAPARIDAAVQFLRGNLGDELAKHLTANLFTSGQIRAIEALQQRFTNQGSGNYSGAHREPNQPERLSNEAYGRLTYSEKKEYAENASREQSTRR
jgi:hypothetical protein